MKLKIGTKSPIISFTLVALAISLIVNFSYMLLMVVNQSSEIRGRKSGSHYDSPEVVVEGTLGLSVDGYGYIIDSKTGDSIYVDRRSVRRLELESGDKLKIEARNQDRYEGAHPIMSRLLERNGQPFDYGSLYNSSDQWEVILYQILFYTVVSLLLLMIMTFRRTGDNPIWTSLFARAVVAVIVTSVAYLLSPVTFYHTGETKLVCQMDHMLDFVVMLKCLFMLAVVLLYSQIYVLIYQRQQILLENEQLQNENLTTRYNMLVSQINPHFFFNSLNSLSMLVREQDSKRALEYIDQLSYTFRYITQNGNNSELVTLRDEMSFAEAYCYMFHIRYADKIFFDISVSEEYYDYKLPALSLQPLIGNAVKHNAITTKNPLHVSIRTENGCLVVSNPIRPLLEPQVGTGIGLQNLCSRYELMLGKKVEIESNGNEFIVRLPLKRA
ncbi:MAG: termination factor Rho [Rikenellaceae bacterium]|nr:termination factor Rho [Rikenellaceae bacterium]